MSKNETSPANAFDDGAQLLISCRDEKCGSISQEPAFELTAELAKTGDTIMSAVAQLQRLRNSRAMSEQADFIKIRDEILEVLKQAAGVDVYALMDGEVSADTIEEVYVAMARLKEATVAPGERSSIIQNRAVAEQWSELIAHTISARVEMMKLAVEYPFVARTMFEPRQIMRTNPGVKMAILQDITRGKDGSIVLKTHENPDIRAYEDQNLLDYLLTEELALAEQMRDSFRCMAIGAQSLGARVCPAPMRYGLCFEVANEIDLGLFPALEQKIITLLAKQRQQNIQSCLGMARSFPFEKIYDVANVTQPAEKNGPVNQDAPKSSKRTANRQKKGMSTESSSCTESNEIDNRITKIIVRTKESLIASVDMAGGENQSQLDLAIDTLMSAPEVCDYIASHGNDSTFISFLRKALLAVIYPGEQIANTHAIKRVRTVKGRFNSDGVFEKAYRLSGNAMAGAGGGKLGKDTRLLFTKALDGSTQYITFYGIEHRSSGAYNLRSFERYF